MAQIDIDKFVISLMRYFGNNKGIVTTLDRCLFSLGLKYVDTPTGGRLERVDQPTMLEKIMCGSGEQKTTENVEPKFKVGEWIINAQGTLRHIINVDKGGYQTDGGWLTHDTYEKTFHLWTIQDAKDGDVVADKSDGTIGIFQSIGLHPDGGSYNDPSYCFLHCNCDDEFFYADFENGNEIDSDDLVPATKEQRDLLFQKMKEYGYEWDAEKKELKKIEQKPVECSEDNLPDFESYLCLMFQKFRTKGICTNGEIIDFVKEHSQKLKNTLCSAWSEEDEDNLTDIFVAIDNFHTTNHKKELITFLKSIKERVNWKPSKEQMVVLNDIIINGHLSNANERILKGLQEQLKKLREG